jgi:hypothetical protein
LGGRKEDEDGAGAMEDPAYGSPTTSGELSATRRVHGLALLIGFRGAARPSHQSRVDITRLFSVSPPDGVRKKDGNGGKDSVIQGGRNGKQQLQKGSRWFCIGEPSMHAAPASGALLFLTILLRLDSERDGFLQVLTGDERHPWPW